MAEKKKSKVKTKRGGKFDSSKELGAGFDERLPSALVEEDFKKGIMGKYSPRAAIPVSYTHLTLPTIYSV